jgi:hypothetical protein
MNALRLLVYSLMIPATSRRAGRVSPPAPMRIYDPYSLAIRPLPADLRIYPHPREISPIRVKRILGSVEV